MVMQGRELGSAELTQIRTLIGTQPGWSRYRLSRELCRLWGWRTATGQIKDMAARTLLLKLEERGLVQLPARRWASPNRMRHKRLVAVSHPREAVRASLAELQPLHRAVLVMRYVDGLAVDDIAAVVGRGTTATNSLLARARAELRRSGVRAAGGNPDE